MARSALTVTKKSPIELGYTAHTSAMKLSKTNTSS
jgi:hypothetical protein